VKTYLTEYITFLQTRIEVKKDSIEANWLSFVKDVPMKRIVKLEENPNYRGLHYNNNAKLDELEYIENLEGWEFLLTGDKECKEEHYPNEIKYYKYSDAPDYRIIANNSYKIGVVYDSNGELVYMPYLSRENEDVIDEIKRLVYLNDYRANKYNIKSESEATQKCLDLWIGREMGLTDSKSEVLSLTLAMAFSSAVVDNMYPYNNRLQLDYEKGISKGQKRIDEYQDKTAERFLTQIKEDHADEFGYLYIIKRLSTKSFKVVYLNKNTLKPSISAIVQFMTGNKPFTYRLTVKQYNTPQIVPSVIETD
ncbi:MAG: hypothetical protein K2M98_00935, partial [Muribaculum sp.]|nr:hypothetical protein [Muribaculum sp.]